MNQPDRRDSGMVYIADEACFAQMMRARRITCAMNQHDATDLEGLMDLAQELLQTEERPIINPPFFCDYGSHIHVGKNFFANYNCTILDVGTVTFGDNCQLAPNVAIYTAGHPLHPATRRSAWEYGIPVTIGHDVWLGGSVVICPGVTIGDNVVIGAGSVVTHDIPSNTVAAGNPCRVLREITDADRRLYFKRQEIDDEAWADICEKNGWER